MSTHFIKKTVLRLSIGNLLAMLYGIRCTTVNPNMLDSGLPFSTLSVSKGSYHIQSSLLSRYLRVFRTLGQRYLHVNLVSLWERFVYRMRVPHCLHLAWLPTRVADFADHLISLLVGNEKYSHPHLGKSRSILPTNYTQMICKYQYYTGITF